MITLKLARKFAHTNLEQATRRYLDGLAQAPTRLAQENTRRLLAEFAATPGPKVYLGTTTWGEAVHVPLLNMVKAMGLATGGMGAGKTMGVGVMVPVRVPDWGTLYAEREKVGQGRAYPEGAGEGFTHPV